MFLGYQIDKHREEVLRLINVLSSLKKTNVNNTNQMSRPDSDDERVRREKKGEKNCLRRPSKRAFQIRIKIIVHTVIKLH